MTDREYAERRGFEHGRFEDEYRGTGQVCGDVRVFKRDHGWNWIACHGNCAYVPPVAKGHAKRLRTAVDAAQAACALRPYRGRRFPR